jgi:hypothetical protein
MSWRCMRDGYVDPHVLDLGTSWSLVVSFMPHLLYFQGRSPWYSLDSRLGGPQDWYTWHGEVKFLAPTGTQTLTPWSSACSQLLYHLHYPASSFNNWLLHDPLSIMFTVRSLRITLSLPHLFIFSSVLHKKLKNLLKCPLGDLHSFHLLHKLSVQYLSWAFHTSAAIQSKALSCITAFDMYNAMPLPLHLLLQ